MNIVQALNNNIVRVSFKKSDGSVRDMLCTLLEQHIKIKTVSRNSVPRNVITVWDVEKDAWRSFKPDSVIEYSVVSYEQ